MTSPKLEANVDDLVPLVELSMREAWARFNGDCQGLLGISAEEFMRKLQSGEIADDDQPGNFDVGWLAMTARLFL